MKKLLMTITLAFGLLLFAIPAFTDPNETSVTTQGLAEKILPNETRACPSCSGDAPVVTGVDFESGNNCTCSGVTSLTVGPDVTVKTGATVTFQSPNIKIEKGTTFENGANVNMVWLNEPVTIDLERDPTIIPADDSSYSIIKATLIDAYGNAVPKGTAVTFTTNLGKFPDGSQNYIFSTYDNTGIVTVFLHSGTTDGTATISATLGTTTEKVTVVFYASGAATIKVKADPNLLTADGISTSTITATAKDGGGDPVADGTEISFKAELGKFDGDNTITAVTTGGVATVTYTAPSNKGDGNDEIIAKANGVVSSDPAIITLTGPKIATVVLNADPFSIPANGTKTSSLTATVTVEGGSSAPAGVDVVFTIVEGGGFFLENGGKKTVTTKPTDSLGIARASLTSDTSPGTASIGAVVEGVSAKNIEIIYEPGSIALTFVPNSLLATGEEDADVTVLVKDADGGPVIDEAIKLELNDPTLGTLDKYEPKTDVKGEATAKFTAASKGGTVTIIATWGDGDDKVTAQGNITIQPPPAFIEVVEGFPDPQKISVKGTGGKANSEFKFLVKDSQGTIVDAGYRIDFSIVTGPEGGENILPLSATTENGIVSGILYSGFKSGPVSIKATYHNDTTISTTSTYIAIVGGPPSGEAFGISTGSQESAGYKNISGLNASGLYNPVTVNIADRYGNAVSDNTAVSFKTYNTGGFFEKGTSVTESGVATDTLVSGGTYLAPSNGFVSVTAEVAGGNSTRVSCIAVTPGNDKNVIYAGTNGGGIYKSIDSGITWKNISRSTENPKQGQNWIDPYVKGNAAISVDLDNHNLVYVGTGYLGRGHVFRSYDGGMNWNSNNMEEWNGIFSADAAVLTVLCDGDDAPGDQDYVWVGTEGQGAWYSMDKGDTFFQSSTLAYGQTVTKIVKVPGTHGADAFLYAGTPVGLYYSEDGGKNWKLTTRFLNDTINTLILNPNSNGTDRSKHYLYVGTEAAGVRFSPDGGTTWEPCDTNGMAEGLSATVPVPNVNNVGNGSLYDVEVYADTKSEFWTVTCVDADKQEFSVVGNASGNLETAKIGCNNKIKQDPKDPSSPIVLSFCISECFGDLKYTVGDSFTFRTTRNPGLKIKDLLLDSDNGFLYAITYFFGPLAPYHAVGNIWQISMEAYSPYGPDGSWKKADDGMPQYSPPDDKTLFAQYALANLGNNTLLVGGEGINMYRSTTGVSAGDPQWQMSKDGLTNLLMARMPVLFSDVCEMKFVREIVGNGSAQNIGGFGASDGFSEKDSNIFQSVESNFTPSDEGLIIRIYSNLGAGEYKEYTIETYQSPSKVFLGEPLSEKAKGIHYIIGRRNTLCFRVYIEDKNGNPPISGSECFINLDIAPACTGIFETQYENFSYQDAYTSVGTYSDPGDPKTNNPIWVNIPSSTAGHVEFIFEPNCYKTLPSVPGCSGGYQRKLFLDPRCDADAPTVTETKTPYDITSKSAESGGTVSYDGGAPVTVRGVCYSTYDTTPDIYDPHTTDGGEGEGEFDSSIDGLKSNELYWVRAYASNLSGTGFGGSSSFTTLPDLKTSNATNITSSSADSAGNISFGGGEAISERGVCYNTTGLPTTADKKVPSITAGTGSFVISITGLASNTEYHVRAYAINAGGTAYGNEITFTTNP